MSNYTKATDFASKDALLSGNPAKVIKGTEIDTEFNNIAIAVATKAETASPTFSGTPTAPTAAGGTNNTQIATTAFVTSAVTTERTTSATLTNKTLTSPIVSGLSLTDSSIVFEGSTADNFETTLTVTDPTDDRTITFPDKTGTVALSSDLPTNSSLTTSSGTYNIAGTTTLTVSLTSHGRTAGDVVYLNFTSGTAVDGNYTIATVVDANSFTITHGTSITTSGNVSVSYSNKGLVEFISADEALVGTSTSKAMTAAATKSLIDATSLVRATAQATTSGTEFDFTGIPSTVKRITVIFNEVSLDGSDNLLVQLGDAGGFETTGYVSSSSTGGTTSTSTAGHIIRLSSSGNSAIGTMTLVNISGNIWISSHTTARGGNESSVGGGSKTLSDVLTQVRITRSGTNNFDAGSVNIIYE